MRALSRAVDLNRQGDKVADHTGPRSAVDLTAAYSNTNNEYATLLSGLRGRFTQESR